MLSAYPIQDIMFVVACIVVFGIGFVGGRLR